MKIFLHPQLCTLIEGKKVCNYANPVLAIRVGGDHTNRKVVGSFR